MFPLPERTVFLPSFDNEDPKKLRRNDRFAYGSVATMRVRAKEGRRVLFFYFLYMILFSSQTTMYVQYVGAFVRTYEVVVAST